MRTRKLFTTFLLILLPLIFAETDFYEDAVNQEFENLAEIYGQWVQKTTTPDMFMFHRFPTQSDNLNSAQISDIQYSSSEQHTSPYQCTRDLFHTIVNLNSQWAIKMLDSDGKIPSGLLEMNLKWPGDYQECLDVYAPQELNSSVGDFRGRYCTVTWKLGLGANASVPLSTGLCVPETCDGPELISNVHNFSRIIDRYPVLKKLQDVVNVTAITCQPLKIEYDGPAIGMLCLLSVIGLLIIAGSFITIFEYFVPPRKNDFPDTNKHYIIQNTSVDSASNNVDVNHVTLIDGTALNGDNCNGNDDKFILLNNSPEEETHVKNTARFLKSFLKSFCIFTNGAKILNTDVAKGQLLCIHGVRFLSMAWVILGHTYAFAAMIPITNLQQTMKAIDTWKFQVVLQGGFSVDSFFVLSGFLLTYLFLKEADKRKGKISWPFFYLHRYWRLTPVYMVALGFNTALTRYMYSGPFWSSSGSEPACHETWWLNLLYINNFGDFNKQCFSWAWYLANDMQFYIISPLFLYTLWRWPKVGLSIISALLLSSWITSGVISAHFNLMGANHNIGITDLTNVEEFTARTANNFTKMYVKPYTRIGPYLIGVFVGFALYKTGNKKTFLHPSAQILGWSIATALPLFVIFAVYDVKLSTEAGSVYNALSRSAFGMGLAWVIYACLTGHGDIVNKILSWKMFIPLSRLTYCAYLVHPIVIISFYQSLKQPLYFSHATMVALFFGLLVMSYMAALITSLALESPMMSIEKLLIGKR